MKLFEVPWDLFPEHRHVGADGSGNPVIVDTTGGRDGPVIGLWHDPPAVVVLAATEAEFRRLLCPNGDLLSEEFDERVDALVWTAYEDRKSIELTAARTVLGRDFSDWLGALPDGSKVVDLRKAKPGDGFSWLRSSFARHPNEMVFVVVQRPGFWRRLFG